MTDEIPPYQSIDYLLGSHRVDREPTPGFAVLFPDNGLNAVLLSESEATEEKLTEIKALSKYPHLIWYRRAWIHEQQSVFGQISNRRYWSPR